MSFAAKSSKSIRKKSTTTQQSPYIGTKALMFAHEITSASQTVINLSSLTTPSAMLGRGFVQPSSSDLATAQLLFYRKNLTLMSSLRGDLWDFDSYVVTGNNSIQLTFTPEVGEIFVGKISDVAKSGLQAIDGKALSVTGTLAAGQTDFVVGQSFSVNKYPSAQVGDVKVFVDGILQARNSGNATASSTADGNYQELDAGSGLANTIRFNLADTVNARSITVVSNGMIAERPEGSLRAEIESLAGQLDQIIPTVAQLAGVAETAFQSAPNDVDLKTFGDRVISLERLASASSDGQLRAGIQDAAQLNDGIYNIYGLATGAASSMLLPRQSASRPQIISGSLVGRYQNSNGTQLNPRLLVEVKDGTTVVFSRLFSWLVPSGFNEGFGWTWSAMVPAPVNANWTVTVTNAQVDGGSSSFPYIHASASASKIIL